MKRQKKKKDDNDGIAANLAKQQLRDEKELNKGHPLGEQNPPADNSSKGD